MDPSTFDLFHHAQRILCRCPNPDCGEISRLSKIDIKSGKESKPTWLDEYEDNMDDYYEDMGEYERTKEDEKAKLTVKGRKQVAKDVKKIMKKTLISNYQKIINYNPYDIKVIGNPVDLVVFDGATKIKEKVKSSGVKSLTGKDIVKEVILLSKKTSNSDSKKLHKSIDEVIQNKEYEWKTANVLEGNIEFE
jgi:predicted Holliday junction resolvase-like endonuclease